jgi:hypothetical protein
MEHNQGLSMKEITVVTTFHQEGLELYGQRFLDSFAKHVDKKIKIIVYAEDCVPNNPDTEQITVLDQKQSLPKLNAFKQRWKNVPKANGQCPFPRRRPKDYHKEFKWDAMRFANKVYAVFDACERSTDWCVWMDADMYVHTDWNYEDFEYLLPDTSWITYVGRGKSAVTWPECGFYGLNLKDRVCKEFLAEFERMYEDAQHGIFELEEWHDSFVFGHILNNMKYGAPNVLDYTAKTILQTAKTGGGGHPLINTDLGKWIDHLKGDRKRLKKSKLSDISVKREEKYWRQQ